MPYAAPLHRHQGYSTPEQRKREVDQRRGKTAERGYDAQWRALRALYLRQHPLCECDECRDGAVKVTAATVVDHRITITERPDLRLEWSNLRSMAKACHDRHTARTQGFAQPRSPGGGQKGGALAR